MKIERLLIAATATAALPALWRVAQRMAQRTVQCMTGRLRVTGVVFTYLLLGLSPAMADDIDIYTKGAVSAVAGAPVIVFQLDSSGSMAWHIDDDSTTVKSLLQQRMFLVQDATRGQLTSLDGDIKVGLFRYLSDNSGLKLADALPLSRELSSSGVTGGTETFDITDGANDVEQVLGEATRPGNATLSMVRYQPPGDWTPVAVPHANAWANSSGQQYSPVGNNVLFLYQHTSGSSNSQTFTLDSTGTPTIDTYLYLLNADGSLLLAKNDDRATGANSCQAGFTLKDKGTADLTDDTCNRWCSNKDVSKGVPGCKVKGTNVYGVGDPSGYGPTSTSGNLNSTVTLSGLVAGNWYQVVAATYLPNQTGPFSVGLGSPGNGTLYKSAVVAAKKQRVGLRFPAIRIPQGATISDAYLEFQASGASNVATTLAVGVDTAAAPKDFLTEGLFTRTLSFGLDQGVAAWTDGLQGAATRLDVTSLVAGRVATAAWCNGDLVFVVEGKGADLDERIAHAYESNGGAPPRLVVTWSPPAAAAAIACDRKEFVWDITTSTEDVYQDAAGTQVLDSTFLEVNSAQKAGLRFTLLPVPPGVTVESAVLELVADATASPGTLYLNAIAEPLAKPFGAKVSALDARTLLEPTVAWTPPSWTAGARYTSPDLKALVQAALDNGWERDGTIGLLIRGAQAGAMRIRAWERTASGSASTVRTDFGQYSARLRVTVTSPTPLGDVKTHRRDVTEKVLAIKPSGPTPISGAFLEVAQYLLGRDGYTPLPELAAGSCANNATIVLTDGDENANYTSTHTNAVKAITSKNCAAKVDAWPCTYDLMDTLFNEKAPFVAASDGEVYSVRTHTVGFGPIAKVGGGKLNASGQHGGGDYYPATNSAALIDIFEKIVTATVQAGTVAAPGVSVNALNRFEHLDELYYSLFKPAGTVDWAGNIKRYRLKNSQVVDVTGTNAVDGSTSLFVDTSESWWSVGQDGLSVAAGGAANKAPVMTEPDSNRLMYTYLGTNGTTLNVPLKDDPTREVVLSNPLLTPKVLGVERLPDYPAMSGPEVLAKRDQALNHLRGGTNAVPRKVFGSAIHASPTLVTFGINKSAATPYAINTLFVGDNNGVLHMIDTGEPSSDDVTTNRSNPGGREMFAFVPQELLPNAALLESNPVRGGTQGYIYGLDARWKAWKNDQNGDREINVAGGDHVYLYGGMRRGGKNVYALDVSTMHNAGTQEPKLLWTIEGGSAGYENIGQTWSDPQPRQILWGGVPRQVLLFGGGYDPVHDDPNRAFSTAVQLGSQVYMVDAKTGELLWRASSEATAGKNFQVADMKYSITAAPVTMDRNGNGKVDGFYVVDLAGQIFRFDLDENATDAATFAKRAALVAQLGATAVAAPTAADNRRFYETPAVAFTTSAQGGDLLIALVSGYREQPINGDTTEMAFMVRDVGGWNMDPPSQTTITLSQAAASGGLQQITAAQTSFVDPAVGGRGWYMILPEVAEKGMSTPVFYNFVLLFTTYVPGAAAAATECAPAIGATRLYVVDALSGKGLVDTSLTKYIDSVSPGIAGGVQLIHDSGGQTTILVGTAAIVPPVPLPGVGGFQQSRWFEVP